VATLPDLLSSPLAFGVKPDERDMDAEDRAAFTYVYEKHAPRIHRFLRDLLGDSALANDATQETFVRAYAHMEVLRDPERAAPWLFGVARNVSLELRKARARRGRVFSDDDAAEVRPAPCPRAATPEGELLDREALSVVDAALATLSEERRAMLLLALDHGLEYADIAQLMGFSLAKVKVEIFRGREILRETLAAYERDAERASRGQR
jgi:RNA polymerase sigma-70 factor (ECF subfamily)